MWKLVVLYRKPEISEEEFYQRYKEHLLLVARVPGLKKVELTRFDEAPWGPPEYFQMAELYFEDRQALYDGLHSPLMIEASKQLRTFAKGLFTMHFAEVL